MDEQNKDLIFKKYFNSKVLKAAKLYLFLPPFFFCFCFLVLENHSANPSYSTPPYQIIQRCGAR